MAAPKSTSRTLYIDTLAAQQALEKLTKAEADLNKKIAEGQAAGKKMTAELQKLDTVKNSIANVQKQIDSGLKPSLTQLETLARKTRNELAKLSENDPRFNEKLKLYQDLSGRIANIRGQLGGAQQAQNNWTASLGDFKVKALAMLGAVGIGFGAITNFLSGSISEFEQSDLGIRNLKNSLENIGKVEALSKLTKQADELASALGYLDNDDIIAAQDKLVSYGKLSIAQIQQLTPVIIDFAAKTKQSVPDATEVFIKALEGSGKGIKLFGVDVSDTAGVLGNFNTLTTDLANKVKGAARTYAESGEGVRASWSQAFRDAQESTGRFINSLIEGKKSADELFDSAKAKADEYENSLNPLLTRYDELKSKTTLNKGEQEQLQGIINEIIKILPDAATGFNKYGVALDINREKVINFKKEQAGFVAVKEREAIQQLTDDADKLRKDIEIQLSFINKLKSESQKYNKPFTNTLNIGLSKLAQDQDKLLEIADILKSKYQTELPASLQKFVDEAKKAKFGSILPEPPSTKPTITLIEDLRKKIKQLTEDYEKIDITNKSAIQKNLAERKKLQDQLDELEGKNDKKASEDAKKAKEKSDEIIKKIREAQQELELLGLNADQKERARIIKKYEDLAEEARKYIVGEAARVKALADIYAMKDKELAFQLDKVQKEYQDKTAKTAGDAAAKIFSDAKKRREDEKKEKERDLADDISISKLRLLQAKKGSVEELNAKLALLDSEREQALNKENQTEAEKALIREQYRQQEAQLQDEFLQTQLQKDLEQIDSALGYLSQVISLIDTFDQAKTNRENAEFNREKKANDAKRAEYKRLLDSKLISELEYKRRVRALDLEEEQKREELDRKQNERRKRTSIAQAIVNGAQAITRALADYSFPDALVPIAFAVATTAAQVAAISGQKYEKGGIARGGRHSEGGIAMVDRRTGRHVGEMEGGEPYMILSRNTYRNNGALIDQLLYNSMYRNGAPVYPAYATRTYQAVNFGAVNRSLSARKFESGGVTDTRTPDMSTDPLLMALIKENSEVNRALLQEIQNGISINLNKIERAQQLQSRIYTDAAING